jgi:hypothetical protein
MGSVLAKLLNIDLEKSEQNLRSRVNEVGLQLNSLQKNPATANSDLIPALRESEAAAEKRLTEFLSEAASLVVRSPADGVFLPHRRSRSRMILFRSAGMERRYSSGILAPGFNAARCWATSETRPT